MNYELNEHYVCMIHIVTQLLSYSFYAVRSLILLPSPAISLKGLNSGARFHEAGTNPPLTANPQSRLCRNRARPEMVRGKMVIGVMFQNADRVNMELVFAGSHSSVPRFRGMIFRSEVLDRLQALNHLLNLESVRGFKCRSNLFFPPLPTQINDSTATREYVVD